MNNFFFFERFNLENSYQTAMSQKQVENNVRFYTMARTKLGDSPEDIHKDLTAVMTESVPDYCTVAKWAQEQSLSPQVLPIDLNFLLTMKFHNFKQKQKK